MRLAALAFVLLVVACSHAHRTARTPGPSPSPPPLGSCETRIVDVDGAQAVITSNADGSLASVEIVKAPDAATRVKAIDDATHYFGPVRRDTRVVARQSRWGLTTYTDPCGRPVPSVTPTPRPSAK